MNIQPKILIIAALLCIGFGYGSGYFTKPTKVETRTVEVVKTVVQKEESKDKIVYKERIVYKDGTVKEIEKTEDRTKTKENSSFDSSKSSEKVVKNDIGLNLSVLAIADASNVTGKREYALHASKRVISNISVGVFASTDKKVGVSVGVSF